MNDSVQYYAFLLSAGSRGIGAEFVRQFAAKGNRVIAGCRCAAASAPGPLSTRRQLAPRNNEYTGDRQWLNLVPLGKRCYDALSKMPIRHLLHAPKAPKAHPASLHTCRQPSQAKELAALEGVELAEVDITSEQSVEAFAASVQQLTPHADVRARRGAAPALTGMLGKPSGVSCSTVPVT